MFKQAGYEACNIQVDGVTPKMNQVKLEINMVFMMVSSPKIVYNVGLRKCL